MSDSRWLAAPLEERASDRRVQDVDGLSSGDSAGLFRNSLGRRLIADLLTRVAGSTACDFSRRADISELMDEPCTDQEFRDCLIDIAKVSRYSLGYRPTIAWLEKFEAIPGQCLHIVDVGCGGGDMLFRIESWARATGRQVRLTGVDINPYAARTARELAPANSSIEWRTGDIYSILQDDRIDLVISSLFTHHLSDQELTRFLIWAESNSRRGWFVNDLHRRPLPYYLLTVFMRVAPLHRFVRNDGPVSIRRSFLIEDWSRQLSDAGIDPTGTRIFECAPARLCVSRIKLVSRRASIA